MEKARATPWPYGPNKNQPMGKLVETRQITLKDLGTVAENAWDPETRQAAIALMLLQLEQAVKEPAPPAGFVKTVSSGRSYSEKKQSWLTLLEGMVLGILLALSIFALTMLIVYFRRPHINTGASVSMLFPSPAGIIAFILIVVFLVLLWWSIFFIPDQITKRLDKQIEAYRLGEEGEERTVQMIVQALDGNWSLFRNVPSPVRTKATWILSWSGLPESGFLK